MSNRLLKFLSLSFVAVILLAQVVDQQHLHVNEPVESVCEVCAHTDSSAALSDFAFDDPIQSSVAVDFQTAVSASLAAKRWARLSRAPPDNLA